jgi:hypothetical protein
MPRNLVGVPLSTFSGCEGPGFGFLWPRLQEAHP